MKIPKSAIYVLALIGFGYCALLLVVSSGLVRSCESQPIVKLVSPSAQLEAKLYIDHCDNGRAPMVTLGVRNMATPDQSTSVELGVATSNDFKVTWLSDNALQVSYPSTFKLSQEPSSVDGVGLRLIPKSGD